MLKVVAPGASFPANPVSPGLPESTYDGAALHTLEVQVADLRDAVFGLLDDARESLPHGSTELHVALQRASNELGEAQRRLHDAARQLV